jgi:hypothetical protein
LLASLIMRAWVRLFFGAASSGTAPTQMASSGRPWPRSSASGPSRSSSGSRTGARM